MPSLKNQVTSLSDWPAEPSSAPDGRYVIRSEKGETLLNNAGGYQFSTWFKTPALTFNTIERLYSIQLFTESRMQETVDDPTAGNWSWFELAIMENEGSDKPWVKDNIILTWSSHYNSFQNRSDYTFKEGRRFDVNGNAYTDSDIFRLLSDGNTIAVRLCTRFPGWMVDAKEGYLAIELGPRRREADTYRYGLIGTQTKALNDIIDDLNRALFPGKEGIRLASKLVYRAESLASRDKPPLRVLALDGGGVRGLAALEILKYIMNKMAPGKKPHEVFDMIAGTSTGGFIAIMLGRLKMDVQECIDEYKKVMNEVFPKQSGLRNVINMVLHNGKWDERVLEKVIKRLVKEKLGQDGDAVLLKDPDYPNPKCKVFVTATKSDAANNQGPALFRSYKNQVEKPSHPDIKLWQAARATSAAPTYFKPMTIDGDTFVDGGLQANNPLGWLWYELLGTYGLARETACFLSIGTGTPAKSPLPFNMVLHPMAAPMSLASVATNSEIPNIMFRTLINAFAPRGGDKKYFRFNVGDGLPDFVEVEKDMWKWVLRGVREEEDIGDLDDVGKIKVTEERARKYIGSSEAQKLVEECVKALRSVV
ncbi:hypothetical protein OQA88_1082 [Cercophora sp. LCS_1]